MSKNAKITETVNLTIDLVRKKVLERIHLLETSEEVRTLSSGTRIMRRKDGACFITEVKSSTELKEMDENAYSYAVKCEGDVDDETIEEAKSIVVDKMCEIIREVAKRIPSKFFIIHKIEGYNETPLGIKTGEFNDYTTVGCKLVLPFALEDEE